MHYSAHDLLELYGINPLTGEADKYSMRLLCDLNRTGIDTISTFFGFNPVAGTFNPNWNNYVHGREAVASIMLPRGTIAELCKFIAFHYMNAYVFHDSGCGYDVITKQDYETLVKQFGTEWLEKQTWRNYNYREDFTPVSDRNEHQMSGRIC